MKSILVITTAMLFAAAIFTAGVKVGATRSRRREEDEAGESGYRLSPRCRALSDAMLANDPITAWAVAKEAMDQHGDALEIYGWNVLNGVLCEWDHCWFHYEDLVRQTFEADGRGDEVEQFVSDIRSEVHQQMSQGYYTRLPVNVRVNDEEAGKAGELIGKVLTAPIDALVKNIEEE